MQRAERLRQLPLSFFANRDLADLADTILSDADRLEHVWSHVLGYLYGAYVSTAIFALGMAIFDWRLALAAFWGVPVAFGLLFGLRGHTSRASVEARQANLRVTEGLQEMLENVSFVARKDEVTALVGPSGSGKSTCAKLAARLWDHDGGALMLGGVEVNDVEPETLMGAFSMVFQDVTLFDDTVMENIRLGRSGATDDEVLAAARAANCDDFVRNLPQGYETPIGENGAKLSGGERQRISIARALLKNAPVLLLDEATASLDVESETRVREALSRLIANKTVLVIAHRMRTVEAADKVVVLDGGRVVEQGSPEEMRAKPGSLFAHMTELQQTSATWQA